MERAEPQLSSSLGQITISTGAVGQIVSQTAARCYGVVGIGGGARAKVGRLLPRGRGTHGITVSADGDSWQRSRRLFARRCSTRSSA